MAVDLPPTPRPSSQGATPPSDAWTSPLWGDPHTVGGHWPAQPPVPAPVLPPPPPPPASSSRRAVVAVAIGLVLALLLGTAGVYALLRPSSHEAGAKPLPSASTAPSAPVQPSPSAPATPPASPQPNNGRQGSGLTAEQQAAAAAVSPGLVDIVSTIGYDGQRGAGTGIVLSSDGLVLTNHHVVAGSTSLKVTDVGNGRTYSATVLGYDKTHDVAVIKLADANGLTVAPLGDSGTVQVGDDVVAIGNAGGVGGTPSAVAGPVTALDQEISVKDEITGADTRLTGLIEVQAAIRPGDSGGALVDDGSTVVGMITAASVDTGSSSTSAATMGYAVPMAQAKAIADEIIAGRSSDTVHIGGTAFLGVQLGDAGVLGVDGVLIAGVVDGSAAEKAGLAPGDVLTAVDGKAVHSADQLQTAIAAHQPGDKVSVTWTDDSGRSHTTSVTLGSGPVG